MYENTIGKHYNGESAIISLTSWSARIQTCGITLFNLHKICPQCHIVLVLAQPEFNTIDTLPSDIQCLIKHNIIELLFTRKNWKTFKKVIFTMYRYKGIPVISADDDCIYTCNYAEQLINTLKYTNTDIVNYNNQYPTVSSTITQGPCCLYKNADRKFNQLSLGLLDSVGKYNNQDDVYMTDLCKMLGYTYSYVCESPYELPYRFHTTNAATNPSQYTSYLGRLACDSV